MVPVKMNYRIALHLIGGRTRYFDHMSSNIEHDARSFAAHGVAAMDPGMQSFFVPPRGIEEVTWTPQDMPMPMPLPAMQV